MVKGEKVNLRQLTSSPHPKTKRAGKKKDGEGKHTKEKRTDLLKGGSETESDVDNKWAGVVLVADDFHNSRGPSRDIPTRHIRLEYKSSEAQIREKMFFRIGV